MRRMTLVCALLTVLPVPMFDPAEAMNQMERHGVTLFFSPPTGYIGLLSHPDFAKHDFSGIRMTVACGAPMRKGIEPNSGKYQLDISSAAGRFATEFELGGESRYLGVMRLAEK